MTKPVVCRPCQTGRHLPDATGVGGCEHRACTCRLCSAYQAETVVQFRAAPTVGTLRYSDDPEVTRILVALRKLGVHTRSRWDDGLPEVLYKPGPSEWPSRLREALERRTGALAYLLVPERPRSFVARYGWSASRMCACYGCGQGVALVDPLWMPRHPWCGWLGQVPDEGAHREVQPGLNINPAGMGRPHIHQPPRGH